MRVIVEVDSDQELTEVLRLLGERPVEVRTRDDAPRRAALERLLVTYHGQLPGDYRFDREEAHER